MARACLIIIDGFGVAPPGPGNAVEQASMPIMDHLKKEIPYVLIEASGRAVGLPEGQQGASEPGHYTIGAGRIVLQPFEQINQDIQQGTFFENAQLKQACRTKRNLHVLIMYSQGGVHSHVDHLHAFLKLAKRQGSEQVYIHLIGDGRDVPEQSLCDDLALLRKEIDAQGIGVICSLVGRYYAMDRDQNWHRTQIAYDLLVLGKGEEKSDFCAAARDFYSSAEENQDTDYYLPALKTPDFMPITDGDCVVNLNFRTDRQRQITAALTDGSFAEFNRPVRLQQYVCMGPYSETLPVAYPEPDVPNHLGEWLSKKGKTQLRLSETEKYAHVTFFFNAQENEPYPGEERIHIPSPKVPSYDQKPEMSAREVADALIKAAKEEKYDFILVNFANPDLVGHSGDIQAVIKACEAVDAQLARILPVLEEHGYDWVLTADHGNAEQMLYPGSNEVCPSHTSNPVRLLVHSPHISSADDLRDCRGLSHIAPFILRLLQLPVPEEMK